MTGDPTNPSTPHFPSDLPDDPFFTYEPGAFSMPDLPSEKPWEHMTRTASRPVNGEDEAKSAAVASLPPAQVSSVEAPPNLSDLGDADTAAGTMPSDINSDRLNWMETSDAIGEEAGQEGKGAGQARKRSPYKLRRLVGRGGCGEVWEARQKALNRPVAVKMIRADLYQMLRVSNERERERAEMVFRQEALATAKLEHPNIAPVYDLGADPECGPLLAMKLIKGAPWNQSLKADFPRLGSADFLAKHLPILIHMAQALAFAHSRGIIHRDFKPAQVMTGEFGEALLMDWGLAVCVTEEAAENVPSFHAAGAFEEDQRAIRDGASISDPVPMPTPQSATNPAGTPALMAPEQTEGTAERIGPWTDVYLLGGTLYYMLTGTYPHAAGSSLESMKLASEGRVQPPAERAPSRDIPTELADLAMKALEREPEDRPPSAKSFAESLGDYMSGSTRRRESREIAEEAERRMAAKERSYEELSETIDMLRRSAEFWADNPALPALFERALGAGTEAALDAGDLRLARVQAERIRPGKVRERLLARVALEENLALSRARERKRAIAGMGALALLVLVGGTFFSIRLQQRGESARLRAKATQKLVGFLLNDLAEGLSPNDTRDAKLIKEIADEIVAHYRSLDTSNDSPGVRLEHAASLADVSDSLRELARYADAADLAEESARLRERYLGSRSVEFSESLEALSWARAGEGKYVEALGLARQALEIREERLQPGDPLLIDGLTLLGTALTNAGDPKGAVKLFERALAEGEKALGPDDLDLAGPMELLADEYIALEKVDEAEELLDRALALRQSDSEPNLVAIASTLESMADLKDALGDFEAARELYEQAVAMLEKELGPDHPDLAATLRAYADLLDDNGESNAATEIFERVVAIEEKSLGSRHPSFADTLASLAWQHEFHGRPKTALELYARALAIDEAAFGKNSVQAGLRLSRMADSLLSMGDVEAANRHAERALAIQKEAVPPNLGNLVIALEAMARVRDRQGDLDAAIVLFEQALQAQLDEPKTEAQRVAATAWGLANMLCDANRPADAVLLYQRAVAEQEKVYGPDSVNLIDMLSQQALALLELGRVEQAAEASERGAAIAERERGPDHFETAGQLDTLSQIREIQGRHEEAEALSVRALGIIEAKLAEDPEDAILLEHYAFMLYGSARLKRHQGDAESLREKAGRAAKIFEPLLQSAPSFGEYRVLLADSRLMLGEAIAAGGDAKGAREQWEEALGILDGAGHLAGNHGMMAIRAKALFLLGRDAEAKAIVERLFQENCQSVKFRELARERGLEPPAPTLGQRIQRAQQVQQIQQARRPSIRPGAEEAEELPSPPPPPSGPQPLP